MTALFGVLSFFGFIACIVLTVINGIRKKPVKPVAIGIAVCFVVLVVCLAISPSSEEAEPVEKVEQAEVIETEEPKVEEAETVKPSEQETKTEEQTTEPKSEPEETQKAIEYDNLQKVFLAVSKGTTENELLRLIEEYGLEYTAQDYNGTPKTNHYKLAYEHGVALQKYADSGDSLEISFNKEDGSLLYAEYFNQASFMNAIHYSYGTYWDFREKYPDNSYSGYYYYKPGDTKGGITIQYNNGNSSETGYHDVSSGEDALANIL